MTAKEIDASFLRHFPAYTITSRLSQSPSLLISGSGSWPQLSLAAENKKIYRSRFALVTDYELDL